MSSERYSRHFVLGEIGVAGQQRLAASTLLLVGCGGLGSTQAELAGRAGVGKLIVVDRDLLDISNLPRQLLFDEQDVRERQPKAVAAARRLRQVNSELSVEALVAEVTAANVVELIRRADLILDGSDNFETRYLLNDAAVQEGKPWIYGGVLGTEGMVMAIRPGVGPCLRCVFPEPPSGAELPSCETRGVLNTAVAWVAALQLTEAIRHLLGVPAARPRLHVLDVWRAAASSIEVARSADCPCCGARRFEFLQA